MNWVHWYNETRLHSTLGYVPPIEFEAQFHPMNDTLQQPLPGELSVH